MTKKQFMALATGLFMSICSTHVFSQEHHYWSHQFGSRSALMGGAVVGGVRDTSAGFYNPGALGFVGESSFSVSANGYKLDWVEIDNGVGTGESLESQEIQNIPLLLSGTFEFGNHTFGYSLLNKNLSTIKMSGRLELNEDLVSINSSGNSVVNGFDGLEEYRGQFLYNSKVDELWGGLSWAKKVSPLISLGVTGFLALRNQNFNITQAGRATNKNSGAIANEDTFQHMDFWNIRGLLKLGVAADLERVKLGATLTTPSISLFGQGDVGGGLSLFYSESKFNLIGDDRQEDLDADYKTPLSLSVGLEYLISQQTRISGTIEWFAKRSRYNVMSPQSKSFLVGYDLSELANIGLEDFDSQFLLKTKDAAESIVNFALAIEQTFNNQYKGYLSFRTDFETYSNDIEDSIPMGINNWDIYHLTVGMTRKSKKSELAIGVTYSFGHQDDYKQLANVNPHNNPIFLFLADEEKTSAKYRSLGLLIGYTYFFK